MKFDYDKAVEEAKAHNHIVDVDWVFIAGMKRQFDLDETEIERLREELEQLENNQIYIDWLRSEAESELSKTRLDVEVLTAKLAQKEHNMMGLDSEQDYQTEIDRLRSEIERLKNGR